MVLAKEFDSLVQGRIAFMNEGVESLLPCRHVLWGQVLWGQVLWGQVLWGQVLWGQARTLNSLPREPSAQKAKPDKSRVTAYIGQPDSISTGF